MVKPGEEIHIKATVLRVNDNLVHAQTPSGQLIQTFLENIEIKPVKPAEHQAMLNAPETKSRRK